MDAALKTTWSSSRGRVSLVRSDLRRREIDGCREDAGVLLCEGLPELGDGVCKVDDLDRILSRIRRDHWRGDKVQLIRSESPHGWLPVPSLQQYRPQKGAPSDAWQTLHERGVYMLDGFMSEAETNAIVSQVVSSEPISSEVVQPVLPTCGFRRSTSWVFFGGFREEAPFPKDLLERIETATKVPQKFYEPSQVVEYKEGDFFSDHYDTSTCDHIGTHKLEELHNIKLRKSLACDDSSRRQGTLIVYLTDESSGEGGATYFPKLNIRVTPKKGRALFFRPTRADGTTDPWMLHSAETLLSGKKFLLQQWMMHGTGW